MAIESDKFIEISNGTLTDADEVMTNTSFILTALLNQSIDGVSTTSQINLKKKSTITYTNINSITLYNGSDDYLWNSGDYGIYGGLVYDNLSDGSVDAAKWDDIGTTSGALTESANTLVQDIKTLTESMNLILTAKALNLNPSTGTDAETIFRAEFKSYHSGGGSSTSFSQNLYIRDASANQVTLWTDSGSLGTNETRQNTIDFRLVIDSNANTCKVYVDGTLDSTKDISSIVDGDDWHLRFEVNNVTPPFPFTQTIKVYPIVYLDGTDIGTKTSTSDSHTITNSSSIIMVIKGSDLGNLSTDVTFNGSNYVSIINKKIISVTPEGTTMKIKHTISGAHGNFDLIQNYALYYSGDT